MKDIKISANFDLFDNNQILALNLFRALRQLRPLGFLYDIAILTHDLLELRTRSWHPIPMQSVVKSPIITNIQQPTNWGDLPLLVPSSA